MRQFPTTPIDNDNQKELATLSQDGACRLEPENSISNAVAHDAGTRDGYAGMWSCTDASELQCMSVIMFCCKTHAFVRANSTFASIKSSLRTSTVLSILLYNSQGWRPSFSRSFTNRPVTRDSWNLLTIFFPSFCNKQKK